MRSATLAALASCLAVLSFAAAAPERSSCQSSKGDSHKPVTMGYYPSYNHQLQSPQELNYKLYTDVLFFVAVPEPDFTFSFVRLTKAEGETLATAFVKEAAKYNVNALLSFGGWTGSRYFSKLTSTEENRNKLAAAMVAYTKKLGFSGLDVDWEFPNGAGIGCNDPKPEDTANFGLLLKQIRTLWPDIRLTAALSINGLIGAEDKPATAKETAEIVEALTYVNLMAYDVYGGTWAPTTGPIAPLSGRCAPPANAQSVETGVAILQKQGFTADKIVLGIPAYAKRLELASSKLNVTITHGIESYIYQNHTSVAPPGGKADDKPGSDVCGQKQTWGGSWLVKELISQGWLSEDQKSGGNGYERHWDKCSGTPFLTDGKYFIMYDDRFSTMLKAEYAKKTGMAGIYFFDTEGPTDATVESARNIVQLSHKKR